MTTSRWRSTRFWMPVALVLSGIAIALVFASLVVLFTDVRLDRGFTCGWVWRLALEGESVGGEQTPEFVERATTGCAYAAAPWIAAGGILFWTGFTSVVLAAASWVGVWRTRAASGLRAIGIDGTATRSTV